MALYSLALIAVLLAGAPYWLVRMMTSGRYRAGLLGRLGRVPAELRTAAAGKQVVWLHAVSVGEVLAATRLVAELEAHLNSESGPESQPGLKKDWLIVVSTTTATGQALARERFGASRVFYYPLDLGWAVRGYLRVLNPRLLILMESELWPRMLAECNKARISVAVANARVSDRSFARGMRVRPLWSRLLHQVTLFLAQGEEDARRLIALGAYPEAVRAAGNLKYDIRAPKESSIAQRIAEIAAGRPVVVAGSTVEANAAQENDEEEQFLKAWRDVRESIPNAFLVLAPRHPQRFDIAAAYMQDLNMRRASSFNEVNAVRSLRSIDAICLDTIGDLAGIYRIASVAFVGGSLVRRGGHNPLEPAQFGVPVVIGPSYENFRDIVAKMKDAGGIRIVENEAELPSALLYLLQHREEARALGERGRRVFEDEQGATNRTVEALLDLVKR